jgi:hypothetical protein
MDITGESTKDHGGGNLVDEVCDEESVQHQYNNYVEFICHADITPFYCSLHAQVCAAYREQASYRTPEKGWIS